MEAGDFVTTALDILGHWWDVLLILLTLFAWAVCLPLALTTKTNATSATAWCLVILFLPVLGAILFVLFGWQHVYRPLRRKRRHREAYRSAHSGVRGLETLKDARDNVKPRYDPGRFPENLAHLALKLNAFPVTEENHLDLYHEGPPAFQAMLAAIESARYHVHLETFILQPDETGHRFIKALSRKAREGVEVRLLYDAMGSIHLSRAMLNEVRRAGGKCESFLPVNPFRRRFQVNLRNHRKILVVDGNVGFCGGLNIGDEYMSKKPRYGFWRDTHFRLEGPATAHLARVFAEDWDFASGERIQDRNATELEKCYFTSAHSPGDVSVQIIDSGPDSDMKSIREVFFAAILSARRRLWIASPYFVPDDALLDALQLAGLRGVDVRFLCLFHPDKRIPLYAARYYWPMVLDCGVKVYQYTKGMMHAKVMIVDDDWATVGTANFDNRSMFLNFEVNALFYSPQVVRELEAAFLEDFRHSIRLNRDVYRRRPFSGQLMENACRLLSPIL